MWDKMETPTIVYDLDTSGGLMEVRLLLLEGRDCVQQTTDAHMLISFSPHRIDRGYIQTTVACCQAQLSGLTQ